MIRLLRVLIYASVVAGLALPRAMWAGDDAPQQLATVSKVGNLAFTDVKDGVVTIEIDFNLGGQANATTTHLELKNFTIDGVRVVPAGLDTTFELKQKQTVDKALPFEASLTPEMAKLMRKFGQGVRVSGSLWITAQTHGFAMLGKKEVTSESAFDADALLKNPTPNVMAALSKVPFFGPDTGKEQTSPEPSKPKPVELPSAETMPRRSSPTAAPPVSDGWMTQMRQRAASNIVIIEASSDVPMIKLKLARQGYRISKSEVVAPIDLQSPLKAKSQKIADAFGVDAELPKGKVQYRAWPSVGSERITSTGTAIPLHFKCGLGDTGLAIFEGDFESVSQSNLEPISVDGDPASATKALQLSYTGLSDGDSFSSATLADTQLAGHGSRDTFSLSQRMEGTAYGSPLFTRNGWLAIVNGPDSAVTATRINAMRESCAVTQPAQTTTAITLYHIKLWSNPGGAFVAVKRKGPQGDTKVESKGVTTAGSKEDCTPENTIELPKGKYHISFLREGYREFGGDVQVDDDMTLGAKLTTLKGSR